MSTVDEETSQPIEPQRIQTPSSPRRRQNIQKNKHNEYSLQELREIALRCEQLPSISEEQYNSVLDQLVKERQQFAKEQNFEESIKFTNAINYMVNTKTTHQRREALRDVENKYRDQIRSIEDEIHDFDTETRKLIRQQAEEQEMTYQRLLKQHRQEEDDHLARWSSDAKVRQYNRASAQLSQLRKQARLLIQQCRFPEAEAVTAQIKELEKKEVHNAHEAMQRDYEASADQMAKRHALELENCEQKFSVNQRNLTMKRKRLRAALENKLEKVKHSMERECDEEKVWNSLQMKKKEEISRGIGDPGIITTKVDIPTASVKDDSTIALPPLTIRRGSTRNSSRRDLSTTL